MGKGGRRKLKTKEKEAILECGQRKEGRKGGEGRSERESKEGRDRVIRMKAEVRAGHE